MKRTISSLVSIALLALGSVAAKATPITFDFSGAITQVSGIYGSIALGATVTGSYTFDLSNANPDQSNGIVGSPSASWASQLIGGSFYFGQLPAVTTWSSLPWRASVDSPTRAWHLRRTRPRRVSRPACRPHRASMTRAKRFAPAWLCVVPRFCRDLTRSASTTPALDCPIFRRIPSDGAAHSRPGRSSYHPTTCSIRSAL